MSHRRAFTLLELMLASALSALLMVGVLAVVADLGASGGIQQVQLGDDQQPLEACAAVIRDDLVHASKVYESATDELTLFGYGALDAAGRRRTHRPVLVQYRFERIGDRRWLVRRQASLDVLSNQNVQRDLVCAAVAKFEVTPRDGPAAPGGGTPDRAAPNAAPSNASDEPGDHATERQAPRVTAVKPPKRSLSTWLANLPPTGSPERARYLARWERTLTDGTRGGVVENEADPGDAADASTDAVDEPPVIEDYIPVAGVWRLRLWTEAAHDPRIDREVLIR